MKKAIILVGILIICLLGVLCITVFNDNNNDDNKVETIIINTPYCELHVPSSFEKNVEHEIVSEKPYVLNFKSVDEKTELFTIYFDQEAEVLLGTLPQDEGNIIMYASFAVLDENHKNYNEYCGYQDGINVMLDYLVRDYDFLIDEIVVNEDSSTFSVANSVVDLQYPDKWKDEVDIDEAENCVKFSADGVKLFDIYFAECDGYLLGTYNKTSIYVISYEFDKENISQEDYDKYCAMQNDINVIIDHLKEDKNFKIRD